ncbi:hypothetical protein EUGRSUZ_I00725 [Eucalyptus grandis]|uniref:Ku C-terminal domain-containing protein n=3 Tax=Eucalyptus grandis TaxID=71139 RepID=A0A059ALY8_EUCGR|nr:hypothetical protein EUGRSUZ_I00725 [Eucalyptus grandis]KAK3411976.1 hypothetical protein EUGRSUZ_I00725 [Eucalyptus grandis]
MLLWGVLTPNVSDNDHMPYSFYFNILPFAEDVREFQFPSFSNLPASLLPDEEQQEAANNFVKMLDLAPSDRKEMLQPDFTPNPALEEPKQFNDFLHQLCKFCLQNDLRSFCDFLATKVFTLISKTEAADMYQIFLHHASLDIVETNSFFPPSYSFGSYAKAHKSFFLHE